MDLSQIPAAIRTEEGGLRAEFLKEVIDRIGRVLWQEIPDNPAQRGPYTHFLHPEGVVKILPVVQEDGTTLWPFSAETMATVRPLFMALEDMPFDETVVRGESTPFFDIRNPARVRFVGFGDHSVDIEILAYVRTNDNNVFLGVREDVFLRLIDIVDASGTGFAFPSTVNYLARDTGVDAERTERTEAIMRELREGDELPFPEFDEETRRGLMDRMEYPGKGCVVPGGTRS